MYSVNNTFYSSCIGVFVNFNFMVPENLFLPSMTQLPVSENLNLGLRHSGFNALDDACRHLPWPSLHSDNVRIIWAMWDPLFWSFWGDLVKRNISYHSSKETEQRRLWACQSNKKSAGCPAWLKLVLPAAALAGADWTQYLPPGNPHKPTCRRNRGTQDLRSVKLGVSGGGRLKTLLM